MQNVIYLTPMLIGTAVSLVLAGYTWKNRSTSGAKYFAPLLGTLAIWSATAVLEFLAPTLEGQLFWAKVQYLGHAPLSVLWLLFVLDFTSPSHMTIDKRWHLLFLPTIVSLVLVWTNENHGLIWKNAELLYEGGRAHLSQEDGLWFWIGHLGFGWLLVWTGMVLLVRRFLSATSIQRGQVVILLFAGALPMIANMVHVLGFSPLPYVDITPISFSIACLLIAWGLFFYHLFDLSPVAFEAVFHAIGDSVVVLDQNNRVTEINPHALEGLGRTRAEVLGQHASDLYSRFPTLVDKFENSEEIDTELTVLDSLGTQRRIEIRTFPLLNWRREMSGRIVMSRDVTEREAYQKRIEEMAFRDFLTGLPNRRFLQDIAEAALALARRRRWGVAVLFLDLDRFKGVNDALGHASGDFLLQLVAARLKGAVRSEDTLARLGGDEFALLMQDCAPDTAGRAAARLLEALKEPFAVKNTLLHVEASVGIALAEPGQRVEELLAQADAAMYQAKQSNKSVTFYDPAQDLFTQELLALESEFRSALENEELFLEYQPVLDLDSQELAGVEALVRWQHPKRGRLEPPEFLHVVEERSLSWALDRHVLQRAIQDLAPFDFGLSVNLSTKSMLDADVYSDVEETLRRYNFAPERLTLEVAERAISRPGDGEHTLMRLRGLGVHIAADEFGAGFSSLTYLRRFPLDALKLDRYLVSGIGRRPEDEAIILAIITIAHSLNLQVVASGIERQEQLDWLRANGCRYAQGHLVAPPWPIEKLRNARLSGPFADHRSVPST